MSKRERHLKQRLDELFSAAEEPTALPTEASAAPIGPVKAPADDRISLPAVIQQLPLPAYVKDREHTWVAINAAYGKLIGHAPNALIGQPDKEQADEAWSRDDRVLDSGESDEQRETVRLSDGSQRERLIQRTALFDDQHQVRYVLGVIQDVRLPDPAQSSGEDLQFKAAFENTVMGLAIVAPDGRFLHANSAWCALLGYTPQELAGMKFRDITHPDDLEASAQFLRKTLAGEITTFQTEKRYLHKNGAVVWVALASTLVRDARQQPLCFITQIQDIAQRKHTADELAKFKLGIDRANAAVTITDVQGTILYVNPAFEKIYGFSAAEAVGQTPRILKSGLVTPDQYQRFWAQLLNGEPVVGEITNKAKDGRLIPVETNNTPILDEAGQVTGFLSIQYDITGRKQAEAELLAYNRQLATLNQLGQELTRLIKPEDVLEHVFKAVGAIFDYRNLYIALYDEQKQEITFPIYTIDGERRHVPNRPFGNSLTEYILRTRVPLHIARDVQGTATRLGIDLSRRPACCYLGVPLLSGDKAFGIIAAQDFEQEDVYTAADVELLSTIGTQTAVALENTRLHLAESRRALQLETAAEISNAAGTVLNVEELLPFVVNLIQVRFGLYYVAVFLVDETRQAAVLRAGTGEAGRSMLERGHQLPLDDRSMIGWCITHETARVASDVGEEAIRFNNPDLPETHSELALPLISRGQVLGAMSVQSTDVATFTPQDIRVLQTMVDQVANAIANAQLFEQTRAANQQAEARLREVQFMQALGQAVSSTLDLSAVMDVIFQTLEHDMGFTHTALALLDKRAGTVAILRATGTAVGLQGLTRSLQQLQGDIMLDILQKGETEVIDGWDDRLDREIWEREGHAALVRAFVPLRLRHESIGVLEVGYWRANRAQITPEEVHLLNGMADQMAIAVGNARLFDESQQRLTELAVVNEISRTLTSAQEIDLLFKAIHQQVGRLFDASNFYIATYDGGDEWSLDYQYEHNQLLPPARHKLGRGFTSYILQSRQPLLIRSRLENDAFHEEHDLPKIGEAAKSWMGVPLIVGGNITGVMGIQSYEREGLYAAANVALFSTIGTQAAAAIQNARLLQDARVRANELTALNELSQTLAAQLSVHQVLAGVWHGVSHLLDTTNFYIALHDPDSQEISFPVNASESVLDKEITVMPASQGITGYIIRTGQPLLIKEDVAGTVNRLGLENIGADSQSYLGVPIVLGDQVLGVVAVQSYTTARSYNEHDQNLLTAIAGQTAIALQNARLFEQTRKQADEAAALNEIMQGISQRVDLDHVLETAYKYIRQLLPTDAFIVALLEGEQLRYPLIYDEGQRFPERGGEARPETNIGHTVLAGQSLLIHRTPEELATQISGMAISALGNQQRPAASLLYVPLRAEQKTIGALSVQSYQLNAYTKDNVTLLERIANQLALAIQNARLFEETSQRNAELATLNEITSSASQTLDLRSLLDMVLTQTLKDFGFDGGLVTVYNETRHKLERVVRTGLPGRIPDDPAEGLENSLCAYVFNSKEPLVIEDFRQGGPIDVSGEVEAGYLSYIGIPIEARGRMLGTWCGFRKSPGAFGKNLLTLLKTIGHQVGFAIENAQFFAQTQTALAETAQLYAASQRLTAAATLQDAVTAMAEGIPVADINRAALWLFERDKQNQVVAAIVSAGWYSGQGVPVMPTGTRLSSEVIKAMPLVMTTEPLFSGDLKTDRRIDPNTAALLQQQRIDAIAILPLWAAGRQIGALLLESERPHAFTDAEIRPYTSLAQQLATTIYNQQLLEQTQRNTQQLTILNELGRDLSQELELDSVLKATFRNLQRLVPLDAYLVGLREGDTDVIAYPVIYDDGKWFDPTTGSLSNPTSTSKVIITGQPVLRLLTAQELANESEISGAMGDVNRPSASLLYAPLQIGSRTFGVLSVQSYQLNAYTAEHVQIVGSVASQVAVAIQNARLFEQVQRTARHEQILRELTTRVRSSTDSDAIVRTTVRELGQALGRSTFIRLGAAEQLRQPPEPPPPTPVLDNGQAATEGGR